jgi:hypothetical protein
MSVNSINRDAYTVANVVTGFDKYEDRPTLAEKEVNGIATAAIFGGASVAYKHATQNLNNAGLRIRKSAASPGKWPAIKNRLNNIRKSTVNYVKHPVQTAKQIGKAPKMAYYSTKASMKAESAFVKSTLKGKNILETIKNVWKYNNAVKAGSKAGSKALATVSGAAGKVVGRRAMAAIGGPAGVGFIAAFEQYGEVKETYEKLGAGKGTRQLVKSGVKVAATVGGYIAAAKAGAAIGAAVGTVVPGIGNIVGAVVGLGIGLAGAWLAGKLADKVIEVVDGGTELQKESKRLAAAAEQDPEEMSQLLANSGAILVQSDPNNKKTQEQIKAHDRLVEVYNTNLGDSQEPAAPVAAPDGTAQADAAAEAGGASTSELAPEKYDSLIEKLKSLLDWVTGKTPREPHPMSRMASMQMPMMGGGMFGQNMYNPGMFGMNNTNMFSQNMFNPYGNFQTFA